MPNISATTPAKQRQLDDARAKLKALELDVVREKCILYNKTKRPGSKAKQSEKVSAIAAIIERSDFGCQKKNVAELISAVIGEPIVVNEKAVNLRNMVIVALNHKPEDNRTGDKLPLNKPLLAIDGDGQSVFDADGKQYEHTHRYFSLHYGDPKAWRFATDKEVETFFKTVKEDILHQCAHYL